MTKKWLLFTVTGIFILAFFLRFYNLGENPPSLNWDEVSIGYNAYSILKTGKDEYGNLLPLSIRSLEDFKPPLYTYLVAPSVFIFGLNEFGVRFPSALFGFLTVIVVFFLTRELFNKNIFVPLVTTLLFAISPWHLQFSRVAFEANFGLFWVILGALFFLKSLKNGWFLILSSLAFGLSLYSYHSERIFTPLFVLGLFFIFLPRLLRFKKEVSSAAILGLLLLFPLFFVFSSGGGLERFTSSSLLTKPDFLLPSIEEIEHDRVSGFDLGRLIHNRRIVYLQSFLSGYLDHFDLNFLTQGDDNPRHHVQHGGLMYFWEIPFLFFGIFYIIKRKEVFAPLIFLWFLLAPVAASAVSPTPHAVRSLVFLPTLQIFTAYGLFAVWQILKANKRILYVFVVAILAFSSLFFYLHQYWVHYPKETGEFWQFGYKNAILEVQKISQEVDKVFVSSQIEQAYIFFLFHSQYDPEEYQKFGSRESFGNFVFLKAQEEIDSSSKKNSLFVTTPRDIPAGFKLHKQIYDPNGEVLIVLGKSD